jgi:hypothetical protein
MPLLDRILASALTGLVMWLAQFPGSADLLFSMQVADVSFGALTSALVTDNFTARRLLRGITLKGSSWIFLGVLIQFEPYIASHGLKLDLVTGFVDGLIAYEFYSICESYMRLNAPGSTFVRAILERVQGAMKIKKEDVR